MPMWHSHYRLWISPINKISLIASFGFHQRQFFIFCATLLHDTVLIVYR